MIEIVASELGPVMGHAAVKREWLASASSSKLHHGWLLRGPRGVGKARLALQFAAYLLGGADEQLSMNAETPIGRLILASSHPDIRIIRRPIDDKGRQKSEIPVESIRELAEFFALRPAMGGWRIAVIDAVDELNRFGANAILKTLEEPPSRAVLFLISHGEQMVLPTIRSRCRVLRCGSLNEHDTLSTLMMAGLSAPEAEQVSHLAPGRPGRALELQGADAGAASETMLQALRNLGEPDACSLQAALSAGAKSDTAMAAAMESLRSSLQKRAARETDPIVAGDWAAAALDVMRLDAEAQALNQDRAQTIAAALSRVARLARPSAS